MHCKSEFNRFKSKVIFYVKKISHLKQNKQKQIQNIIFEVINSLCFFVILIYFLVFVCLCACSLLVDYSTSSKFSRIAQKLGISEPPKRPTSGYIRFQQENLPTLKQSSQSPQELIALVAAKWRHLSTEEKEKYNKQFHTEIVSEYKMFMFLKLVNFLSHFFILS